MADIGVDAEAFNKLALAYSSCLAAQGTLATLDGRSFGRPTQVRLRAARKSGDAHQMRMLGLMEELLERLDGYPDVPATQARWRRFGEVGLRISIVQAVIKAPEFTDEQRRILQDVVRQMKAPMSPQDLTAHVTKVQIRRKKAALVLGQKPRSA